MTPSFSVRVSVRGAKLGSFGGRRMSSRPEAGSHAAASDTSVPRPPGPRGRTMANERLKAPVDRRRASSAKGSVFTITSWDGRDSIDDSVRASSSR